MSVPEKSTDNADTAKLPVMSDDEREKLANGGDVLTRPTGGDEPFAKRTVGVTTKYPPGRADKTHEKT